MNNNRIVGLLLAICMAASPTCVFAADANSVDFNPDNNVIEGSKAPTAEELKNEVYEAYKKNQLSNIKEIGSRDYSAYVARTDNISVSVKESNQWKMNREVLGIQMEFDDLYNYFFSNNKLKPDYVELQERAGAIPVLRIGGAASTDVNMLYNVGPYTQRKLTPKTSVKGVPELGEFGGRAAYRMGIPETLTMLYANNPDASIIPCISLWCMSPEDIINLCHYFYDDEDASEWGALRAADGFKEPINVWYWELGNETDGWTGQRTQLRMDNYVKYARAASEAIRSVKPDAKIMANGPTAPHGGYWGIDEDTPQSWAYWHKTIMPQLVDIVDGISHHPYYDGYSSEFCGMYFADRMKEDMDSYVREQDIRDADGNLKEMEVIATEHNRYVDYGKINWNFESAVSTSHFYNLCFQRPWFTGANLHALVSDGWCGYYINSGDGLILSPTAKMHKMYVENMGDRICESSWLQYNGDEVYDPKADPYFEADNFSVVTSINGDNELKIILTNKIPYRDIDITFNFEHDYTLVEETVFKAPNSATTVCSREMEDLVTVTSNAKNIPNFTTYKTPTEGVVVLTLRTGDRLPRLGEKITNDGAQIEDAPEAETLAFSDIAESYAKNEITYLSDNGIIHGRTETEFAPKENISRAELGVLLATVLKLEPYKSSRWADVPDGAWYAGAANALYIERIFEGDLFRGDECIAISDLMNIAGKIAMREDDRKNTGEIEGNRIYMNDEAAYAVNKGLFSNILSSGNVDTDRNATREDAAAVIYKLSKMIK